MVAVQQTRKDTGSGEFDKRFRILGKMVGTPKIQDGDDPASFSQAARERFAGAVIADGKMVDVEFNDPPTPDPNAQHPAGFTDTKGGRWEPLVGKDCDPAGMIYLGGNEDLRDFGISVPWMVPNDGRLVDLEPRNRGGGYTHDQTTSTQNSESE